MEKQYLGRLITSRRGCKSCSPYHEKRPCRLVASQVLDCHDVKCVSTFLFVSPDMHEGHLIYFEGYLVKEDALGREKFLKSGSGYKYLHKQLKHYLPVSEIKDNLDRSVENANLPV